MLKYCMEPSLVSSTNCHDITEILLKGVLNTITSPLLLKINESVLMSTCASL